MGVLVLIGLLQHGVFEGITLTQCAVAVIVIVHPLIDGRCLLADGFERGVRMKEGQTCGEAVVGDSVNAHLAVVVGYVFDEPVDGVVGIVGFVGLLRILGVVLRGKQEDALGFEAAAEILHDEDVAVGGQLLPAVGYPVRAFFGRVLVEILLGGNTVGGAGHEDGQRLGLIGFADHDGLQMHTVAHGHHEFLYPVIALVFGQRRRLAARVKRIASRRAAMGHEV